MKYQNPSPFTKTKCPHSGHKSQFWGLRPQTPASKEILIFKGNRLGCASAIPFENTDAILHSRNRIFAKAFTKHLQYIDKVLSKLCLINVSTKLCKIFDNAATKLCKAFDDDTTKLCKIFDNVATKLCKVFDNALFQHYCNFWR